MMRLWHRMCTGSRGRFLRGRILPSFAFEIERLELPSACAPSRNPSSEPTLKPTVLGVITSEIADVAATAMSRYSLFLLSLRITGYLGERYSGGRTLLRTHDQFFPVTAR
jgi:hypothetical protein